MKIFKRFSRRCFKNRLYDRNSWICGCDVLNRFFCFPCLLFAKCTDKSWTKTGIADLAHLSQSQTKHEKSLSHVQACRDLSLLRRTEFRISDFDHCFDADARLRCIVSDICIITFSSQYIAANFKTNLLNPIHFKRLLG